MSFIINLIAKNAKIKANIIPTKIGSIETVAIALLNNISYMQDAIIIGIDIKKLNFATLSLFSPQSSPAQIVEPEREIPGSVAIPCAIPIIIATLPEIGFLSWF